MADLNDDVLDAALQRGSDTKSSGTHATSARYDRKRQRVIIDLDNGSTFAFPPHLVQGLSGATENDIEQIELLGNGYGLHWEALDVDYTVSGLLAGIFGTASYMARKAGRATSPAKAVAARINGAKGGRPRKTIEG